MPRTQPIRIGNSVIVSDKNHPEYGQYATVEDYDKVRNMLTLRPDQVSPNGPLTYKLLAPKATLATHGQPSFTPAHVGDQAVVVNVLNALYGEIGLVELVNHNKYGVVYTIREQKTGSRLCFYGDELSPTVSVQAFLSGSGGLPNTGVVSRQQGATQAHAAPYGNYSVGDWVEVASNRSIYNGSVGRVDQILTNGNLMLDFGGPTTVEMHPARCKMYHPVVNKTAQPLAHPWATNPFDGSDSPEPESDSFGVGQPKEKVFDHASLGTDLTGDELMKSIRDICGGR